MSRPVIINGLWFCGDKISGVRRYATQVVENLDTILDEEKTDIDIRIAYPGYLDIHLQDLHNIQIVKLDTEKVHFNLSVLRKYIKQNNGIWCDLGNAMSYNRNGVVCMHDIRDLVSSDYTTNHNRRLMIAQKWTAKIMNSTIVTVSEYQKKQICEEYKVPESKVFVIPNGWEHISKIVPDENVFAQHPEIREEDYYYSIGNVARHKNYKWIHEMAKKYESRQFVIAGNIDKNVWGVDDSELHLPNVIFLGYVTDEENKALMQHCRAFLHPAKYEGFGIPPLEALAIGKKIIISNATCLPEIYRQSASYFDPDDYDVDLDELERAPVREADVVLEKYTWRNAARGWLELFRCLGA